MRSYKPKWIVRVEHSEKRILGIAALGVSGWHSNIHVLHKTISIPSNALVPLRDPERNEMSRENYRNKSPES